MRTIWEFLAEKLGMNDLRQSFHRLEQRLDSLEKVVTSALRGFGGKEKRTGEELSLMKHQINNLLDAVEDIIESQENKELIQDAKSLRRKLRNHKTRISKLQERREVSNG